MNKKLHIGLILFLLQTGYVLRGSSSRSGSEEDTVVKALAVVNASRIHRALHYAKNRIEALKLDNQALEESIKFFKSDRSREVESTRLQRVLHEEYKNLKSLDFSSEHYQQCHKKAVLDRCRSLENRIKFFNDNFEINENIKQFEAQKSEQEFLYLTIATQLQSQIHSITGQLISFDVLPTAVKRIELSPKSVVDSKFSPKEVSGKKGVSVAQQDTSPQKFFMHKDHCVQYCQKVEKNFMSVDVSAFSSLIKVK